jgi:hypothetical protein
MALISSAIGIISRSITPAKSNKLAIPFKNGDLNKPDKKFIHITTPVIKILSQLGLLCS